MKARGPLLVYGAGGHGLVVAEAAQALGFEVAGFIDDGMAPGVEVGRWAVLGGGEMADELAASCEAQLIVAIGDNRARWEALNRLIARRLTIAAVIHPTAFISDSAAIEPGVFIGPRAVVHSEARIEQGAIINSGAIIEHHVQIGASAHVAPGAVLTGRASAGARVLIGAAAAILPGVRIGDDAIVGAGAVVLRDVADAQVVVGNPARPTSRLNAETAESAKGIRE